MNFYDISIIASSFVIYNTYKLIKPVLENYYVTLENGPSIKNYGGYL
jgi:hypothetical protein